MKGDQIPQEAMDCLFILSPWPLCKIDIRNHAVKCTEIENYYIILLNENIYHLQCPYFILLMLYALKSM